MPNFTLSPLLLVLLFIFCISGLAESFTVDRNSHPSATNIYKSCKNTTYPTLCVQYLSIFPQSMMQNPKKIAKAALLVSLYRVQITRSFIKKASTKLKAVKGKRYHRKRDHQLVEDCLEVMSDGLDNLNLSIIEFHRMEMGGRKKGDENCDIACHVSNIQNYLSSALTDASTCVDEFDELKRKKFGKLMATIKAKALNAEQATTIGLDLFCQSAKCSTWF